MTLFRHLALAAATLLFVAACTDGQPAAVQRPQGPSPLNQGAAVVVGGDWRDSDQNPIPIFDNARRDVAQALLGVGFRRENMLQLSVNTNNEPGVYETNSQNMNAGGAQTTQGRAGCLFYFTSHGNQQGIIFGRNEGMSPQVMAGLVNQWCGQQPTVVIVSACFSGVFVPALQGPNRMVMTAARPDRSSFGCGGTDRYPYFDECVLQSIPQSTDFLSLAQTVTTCVQRREEQEGATPPSEPQVSIGDQIRPVLASAVFVDGSAGGGQPQQQQQQQQQQPAYPPQGQPQTGYPPQGQFQQPGYPPQYQQPQYQQPEYQQPQYQQGGGKPQAPSQGYGPPPDIQFGSSG